MRDGIKKHIDWEKEGIEFVGEASDGELAYPMILDLKPDILITDIKMPFMDGLELSELVKKELPNINIIILSGYDEFTYAQKAVSLGVTEYLLKPVTPSGLLETIKKVQQKIEEERQAENEVDWSREEIEEKNDVARLRLFEALIMNSMSTAEILDEAKELGLNLTARYYRIVRLYFGVEGEQADAFSEARNAFRSGLTGLIDDSYPGYYLVDRGIDGFILLLTGNDENDVDENLENFIQKVVELTGTIEASQYFIGVGSVVNRLSEIKNTYFEANRAFAHRFLDSPNQVVYSHDAAAVKYASRDNQPVMDISRLVTNEHSHKALETFLKTGSFDEAEPFMDSVFSSIGEQNLNSVMFLNYITMDCYFIIVRFLSEIGGDPQELEDELGNINVFLKEMTGWKDSLRFLKECLKRVIGVRDSRSAKKYGKILHKAIEYIDENFDKEDISLNAVSSVANISPNHFSAIFSQEMGVTFIEYLIRKRMERAKELLMTTDLRSSEIAYQVGYKDPHYFSFTFKKTQGMTTREYRSRGKGDNEE